MANSTFETVGAVKNPFIYIAHTIVGCAIGIMNIILVFGFTKKKELTKISFIFLSNLGISDVMFGFVIALRSIFFLIDVHYLDVVCRVVLGGICATSLMSAICILLLSIQVVTLYILWRARPTLL